MGKTRSKSVVKQLKAAWDAYEYLDYDDALRRCSRLPEDDPERWLLEASVHTSNGEFGLAEEAIERGREAGASDADGRWPMTRAELALQSWKLEEAERELNELLARKPRADACNALAVVHEVRGDYRESDRLFDEAHRLQPRQYPRVRRISPEEFQSIVDEAIEGLPPEYRELLAESEVIVAPTPSKGHRPDQPVHLQLQRADRQPDARARSHRV